MKRISKRSLNDADDDDDDVEDDDHDDANIVEHVVCFRRLLWLHLGCIFGLFEGKLG